jgi:TPR repeat protein
MILFYNPKKFSKQELTVRILGQCLIREFPFLKDFSGNKDIKKAKRYFKKSADLGNSEEMVHYGQGLEKGFLGKKNLKSIMKYYKMAVDIGNSGAIIH